MVTQLTKTRVALAVCAAANVAAVGTIQAAELDEIIVTAQRRAENLQEVPISVSVHTGEYLESLDLNTVNKLVDVTPGLVMNNVSGYANPFIRGVGANTGTPGSEVPVATYIDGAYVSDKVSSNTYDFLDVERIEVLKGPQGTLFGRNATGGAINIVTRQPSDSVMGQAEVGFANDDTTKLRAFISGPITERLLGSLSVLYKDTDGYLKNVNPNNGLSDSNNRFGDDVGRSDSKSVRAKLLWRAADDVNVTLSLDYNDEYDGLGLAWQPITSVRTAAEVAGASQSAGTISRTAYNLAHNSPPIITNEAMGANVTVDWSLDFADFKSITSYHENEVYNNLDRDLSGLPLFSFDDIQTTEYYQQEFQLASTSDSRLQWVGGLFYLHDEQAFDPLDVRQGASAIWPFTPATLGANNANFTRIRNQRTVDTWAAFGEATYDFSDRTSLTLGLRYTEEQLELDDDRGVWRMTANAARDGYVATQLVDGIDGTDTTFEETTWSIVFNNHFTDDLMSYASYKRGFKSGVYNISSVGGAGDVPTDPEIIDAYEIGFKSTLLGGSVRLNGAAFYYDYKDLQVQVTNPSGAGTVQITENAAAAEIRGFELTGEWRANDNLAFTLGFSYLDTEYSEYDNATVLVPTGANGVLAVQSCVAAPEVCDLGGAPLPFSPKFTTNLGVHYTIALANDANIVLAGNWYHSDDYELLHTTRVEQDAYDRVNVSATWNSSSERFYVKLWGNNLLDEEVFTNVSPNAFGHAGGYFPPLTYGITAGFKYGM